MTLEPSSIFFSCASLICSVSMWLGLFLSLFLHRVPGATLTGGEWLTIQGAAIALAVIAAILNFEKRIWILALVLASVTFLLVIFANGV